jgi:hypothetical protein
MEAGGGGGRGSDERRRRGITRRAALGRGSATPTMGQPKWLGKPVTAGGGSGSGRGGGSGEATQVVRESRGGGRKQRHRRTARAGRAAAAGVVRGVRVYGYWTVGHLSQGGRARKGAAVRVGQLYRADWLHVNRPTRLPGCNLEVI